ncbi:MAG: hypothetical protein A3J29_15390 [Acidobacteria bacterium RIFCSPLOWO2_12_FULL_67_14b]|nr:MAG: hypothetical protein A3J29_15390 [Acidobacteria bacterium RIFCSPLOWO2_12_FULL_67_14b]
MPAFLETLGEPVQGMRMGIMRRWFFDDLDPDVERAMEATIDVYRDLGVEIVEVDLGDVENAQSMLTFGIVVADALQRHQERIERQPQDYGDDVLMRMRLGEKVSGVQYAQSMRWMEAWRHRLKGVFRDVDALLSPTTPRPAPAAKGLDFAQAIRQIPRFSCAWPMAGIPSLAVPCGFSADGLPLSHELAAPCFCEPTVLRLGHAFQSVTDHHLQCARLPDA